MSDEYFFNDVDECIKYINNKLIVKTPIRLQKTLYFLWAIYSGTYGNMGVDNGENEDIDINYPKYLFPVQFEAWQYGPVIKDVCLKYKLGEYDEENLDKYNRKIENEVEKDILNFIDDLIQELNKIPDFNLVQRSHQDNSWKNVYIPGEQNIKMNLDDIKKEYIQYAEY